MLNFIKESVTEIPVTIVLLAVSSRAAIISLAGSIQYRSKVSWHYLETWYSKLDSRSSILENFKDRGSSWVSSRSRLFENLLRPFENLSSQVSRLFVRLTFDTSESYGKHILALPAVQVHDISINSAERHSVVFLFTSF